jgi:hypothetical protein
MPNKEEGGKSGQKRKNRPKRKKTGLKNVLNMLMRPNSKKYQ